MKITFLVASAWCAFAVGSAFAAGAPSYVARALADQSRPKDDRAADALRDPADTLSFAGVRPGMVVGELFPGGGYYTRLLSDVVGPGGKVYGLENAGWNDAVKLDQQLVAESGRTNVSLDIEPFGQFALPEKIDLFWITQNYHDLHIAKYGAVDMAAFNRRVFESLKPGGVYFILDHEANPGVTLQQIAALHRIEKAKVIAEVTAAGFQLADEGKFLNRPGDDHSKTIFDPAIRGHTDQYAPKIRQTLRLKSAFEMAAIEDAGRTTSQVTSVTPARNGRRISGPVSSRDSVLVGGAPGTTKWRTVN